MCGDVKKPESGLRKKHILLVRLSVEPISSITSGERLIIPVHNRFDHTNLSEINIRYTRNGNVPKTISLNLAPHEKGNLILPDEDWQDGDRILVEFYTAGDQLIDANLITIGEKKVPLPYNSGHKRALRVTETDEFVIVEGDNFTIPFSRHTGLICNAVSARQGSIGIRTFSEFEYKFKSPDRCRGTKSREEIHSSKRELGQKGFCVSIERW